MSEVKDAPAFDFYPERFWFAVEGWSEGETCRYFRLLSQQWLRNGLPADPKDLAGLARGKVTDRLLLKFPVAEDGLRRNLFLEKLRSEQRERINRSRDKAKKMADARWSKHPPSNAQAYAGASNQALHVECPPLTSHLSPLKTPIPPESDSLALIGDRGEEPEQQPDAPPSVYSDEFLDFWDLYPRKIAKGKAWLVWKRLRPKPDFEDLVASIKRQKSSDQWVRDGGQFIPHPATWLNGRRWEDEVDSGSVRSVAGRSCV